MGWENKRLKGEIILKLKIKWDVIYFRKILLFLETVYDNLEFVLKKNIKEEINLRIKYLEMVGLNRRRVSHFLSGGMKEE